MAERRTIGDAMEITPEKLAFIKGQAVNPTKRSPIEPPTVKDSIEKTIEIESPSQLSEKPNEPRLKATRRSTRSRSRQDSPEASDLLDQVLVPVTIRLQHRTAQALRRAYLEQRLKHAKPDTQQEIVEEAIADWLTTGGYLD